MFRVNKSFSGLSSYAQRFLLNRNFVINGNQIRPGMALDIDGSIYRVTRTQHVKPGKGGAYMQADLKDEKTGNKLNKRFRVAETVKKAQLDSPEKYQLLYLSGDIASIMHVHNFEQVEVDIVEYGIERKFLEEGIELAVQKLKGSIYSVALPPRITLTVSETRSHSKTASINPGNFKTAVLSNGMQMKIPPFIENGEKIIVCTETSSYLERHQK